jgi:hypothetical protein
MAVMSGRKAPKPVIKKVWHPTNSSLPYYSCFVRNPRFLSGYGATPVIAFDDFIYRFRHTVDDESPLW